MKKIPIFSILINFTHNTYIYIIYFHDKLSNIQDKL